MQTTSNGIMIPDVANSSSTDNLAGIISAVINNANAMNTIHGNLSATQSDYTQGWWKSTDGFIIQWGHPATQSISTSGGQAIGTIAFPTAFSHVCLTVVGSDAGGQGMGFGFYGLHNSGCTWCTCEGIGRTGIQYSPNYIAFGW